MSEDTVKKTLYRWFKCMYILNKEVCGMTKKRNQIIISFKEKEGEKEHDF